MEEVIKARLDELKENRVSFVRQVERQMAHLDGAIAALEELLAQLNKPEDTTDE